MKRSAPTVAVITLALTLLVTAQFNVYLNFEDCGATALWNDQEAYLFLGRSSFGHRVSLLRFPWFLVKSRLGDVELPDDQHRAFDAIRVSSSGVDQHALDLGLDPADGFDLYTPLEGRIYANCPSLGGLCRWEGDHFASATPAEKDKFEGINHLTNNNIYPSVNGWSKRLFHVGPIDIDDTFQIDVGQDFRLVLSDLSGQNEDRIFSVDLQRPGKPTERIWSRNITWGRISKVKYQRVFGQAE
jgi:hypothetical protein